MPLAFQTLATRILGVCATRVSRKGTRIHGACVHSVGRLRLTKEWTEKHHGFWSMRNGVVSLHSRFGYHSCSRPLPQESLVCATTASRTWTRIRGACFHSVGRLRGPKNTTDSGPSKGSVVPQHTQRVRSSLVFPDTWHKFLGVCDDSIQKGTRIRGACVHSVGRLQLTKEWTENTTDSGP